MGCNSKKKARTMQDCKNVRLYRGGNSNNENCFKQIFGSIKREIVEGGVGRAGKTMKLPPNRLTTTVAGCCNMSG